MPCIFCYLTSNVTCCSYLTFACLNRFILFPAGENRSAGPAETGLRYPCGCMVFGHLAGGVGHWHLPLPRLPERLRGPLQGHWRGAPSPTGESGIFHRVQILCGAVVSQRIFSFSSVNDIHLRRCNLHYIFFPLSYSHRQDASRHPYLAPPSSIVGSTSGVVSPYYVWGGQQCIPSFQSWLT